MTSIVQRLRDGWYLDRGDLIDAANEIERLRAENERLRGVIVTAIEHLDNCCWYDAEAALQAALAEQENDR